MATQKTSLGNLELYPKNPRTYDLGDIKGLAATIIAAGGIITPLKVFKDGGKFMVVDGQRRLAALTLINEQGEPANQDIVNNIPYITLDKISEVDISFNQLLSNEGKELTPLEIAEEILRLKTDWELTPADISTRLGKSKVYVNELIRVAQLPDQVKGLIKNGTVAATMVRQQIKNGTLDEFIASITEGNEFEQGENHDSEDLSRATKSTKTKQAKVTAKNSGEVNSMREFKRFSKAFQEIFPNEEVKKIYDFVTGLLHNNYDYNYFVEYFTGGDVTALNAAIEEGGTKKAAKKTAAKAKKAAQKEPKKAAAKGKAGKGAKAAETAAPKATKRQIGYNKKTGKAGK